MSDHYRSPRDAGASAGLIFLFYTLFVFSVGVAAGLVLRGMLG